VDGLILDAGETVQRKMQWLAATPHYEGGVIIEVPLPAGTYRVHAYLIPGWPLPWDTYLSAPRVVRLVEQEPASSATRF
jgi:hypothetical protein